MIDAARQLLRETPPFLEAQISKNYPPVVDAEINTRVHANVRSAAHANVFESAPQIVQEALLSYFLLNQ